LFNHLFTTTGLKGNGTLPELPELKKLQGNPKTMIFSPCIVGKVEWKQKVTNNLVKEFATNAVMKDLHCLFWKTSGMNGVKLMQKIFLLNTETS